MHERCGTRAAVGAAISLEGQRVSSCFVAVQSFRFFCSTYRILQKNTCQSWTPSSISSWLAFQDRLKKNHGIFVDGKILHKNMGSTWVQHGLATGHHRATTPNRIRRLPMRWRRIWHIFPRTREQCLDDVGPTFSQVALSGRPSRGFQGFQVGSKLGPSWVQKTGTYRGIMWKYIWTDEWEEVKRVTIGQSWFVVPVRWPMKVPWLRLWCTNRRCWGMKGLRLLGKQW